jgi:hypothetical protein
MESYQRVHPSIENRNNNLNYIIMKTVFASSLLLILLQLPAFSQNRICGWDTGKIRSAKVEYTFRNQEKESQCFTERNDMDAILSFLKSVNFRTLNSANLDSLQEDHSREYIISFEGQRDQVYLYTHSACIGKTSFLINPEVIRDFEGLIKGLMEQGQSKL